MGDRPHYAIHHLIEQSARFLVQHARCDGGFYGQEVGIGKASATTTANCIRSLWASGSADQKTLHSLVDELFQFQGKDGAFRSEGGASHNFATAKSITSILLVRPDLIGDLRVQQGLTYLLGNRNVDTGAWGYKVGYNTRPYYSFFAAEALVIAYNLAESDQLRLIYETALHDTVRYLRAAQVMEGVWANGESSEPCPINTLTALATLRAIEQSLDLELIGDEALSRGRELLDQWFMDPQRWSKFLLLERGDGFYIREFFPGTLFLVLPVFGPLDPIATCCVGWLQKSCLRFNGASIGWPSTVGDTSEPICVWATAESLYSLALYGQELRALSKVVPFDNPSRSLTEHTDDLRVVNRSDLRLVLTLLGVLILLPVALTEIWIVILTWRARSNFWTWETGGLLALLWIPVMLGGSVICQLRRFYKVGRFSWTVYRYRFRRWVRNRFPIATL